MGTSVLKEKTSRGFFWGGTSSFLQQLLNAAFGIYLARTLSPDDYGLVGMLAIFNMLAYALQDGGFVSALINRKEIRHEDYNAVFWFSALISLFCYLVFFLCAPGIARFFHHPELVHLARWNFLGFVIFGFGTAHRAYLMKRMMVRETAISNILSVVLGGGAGVFLAWKGFAYWALVVQALVTALVANLGFWLFSRWKPSWRLDFRPVREMLRYGIKLTVTNIFNNISTHLVTVALGRCYSAERVGFYTQANKWYTMGCSVLPGMVNSVAQPVLVSVDDERGRQLRVFRKMVRVCAFLSFPAMFGLAFIAPEFITAVLTEKWADSIVLLQVLCIGGAFVPLVSVCSNLILSKGGATQYMWINTTLFVTVLCMVYLLHPFGVFYMVSGITAANVLWLLVWHFFVKRETGYRLKDLLADLLPFLGVTALSIAAAWLLTRGVEAIWLRLVAKIMLTALLYFLVMWASGAVVFRELIDFVFKRKNQEQ